MDLTTLIAQSKKGTSKSSSKDDKSGEYMKNKTATIEWLVENGDQFSSVTEALVACPTTARKTIKSIMIDADASIVESCLLHPHMDNKSVKKFIEEASPDMRAEFSEAVTIRYAEAAKLTID